ncbi:hypothetical protein ACQE98_17145 [Ornithinimicrobium sp. W1679]|uniref:hypothetical protein n=1 Tax=unclassified Ornithinimicrobium TaxID=2615080 RepID=UPI003CF0A84D
MSEDLEDQRTEAREALSSQGAGMGMDEEPTTFEPEEDPDALEEDDPERVLPDEERAVGDAESEEERLLPDEERRVPDLAPELDAPG